MPRRMKTRQTPISTKCPVCLGVKRTQVINVLAKPMLISLSQAIVRHENGKPPEGWPDEWYAPELYAAAADMALKN